MTSAVSSRQLEVILQLQDKMTKELRRVQGGLGDFERGAKRTGTRVSRAFDKIRAGAVRIKAAVKGLLNPLTLLGGAVGVGAVIGLARSLSTAAAAAEELQSKFEAVFGDDTQNMQAWVDDLSESVKRGRLQIQGMVADTQPFLERMLGSAEAGQEASKALTQLAIDVGSFYNVADEDVLLRFRSALVGSGEALDIFGARIEAGELKGEAFRRGITEVERELTSNEKAITRLAILYDRFPAAIGDAERTAGSFTNQMKALSGVVADLRAEFGARLNQAILEGLDDAGGVEAVKDLTAVFFAAVAEFAGAGVRIAGQVANAVAAAMDRFGGADGVISFLQANGELFLAQVKLFGLGLEELVQRFADSAIRFAGALRSVGLLDGPNAAEGRSLGENQNRAEEIRAEARAANRERLRLESTPGSGSKQIRDQEQYIAALNAEYEALGPVIERQKQRAGLEAEIALAREKVADAGSAGGGGAGFEPLDLGGSGFQSTLDQMRTSLDALFQPQSAVGGGSTDPDNADPGTPGGAFALLAKGAKRAKEQVEGVLKVYGEFAKSRSAFVNRNVANAADAFLSIATGAQKAGDAVRNFFRVFISDLLRLQTVRAFNTLFGGAFGAAFGLVNPAASFAAAGGGVVPNMPAPKGYAAGGSIAATDTVPAMLTPGEFVMSKGAVDRIGVGNLAAANSGAAGLGGGMAVNVQLSVSAVDSRDVMDLIGQQTKRLGDYMAAEFARNRNLRSVVRGDR